MKIIQQFWQGDLLLVKIEKLPRDIKKVNTRILALGESTNHAHRLDGGQVCVYEQSDKWRRNFAPTIIVEIIDPATLVHVNVMTEEPADHAAVELPVGIYQVIRQIEVDPFDRKSRMVLD